MLLASYKSTRPGLQGLFNRLIRWRFDGIYSHTEVVFEPGDPVGHLMHDGTTAALEDGSLWSVSSVAAERLPDFSARRAGKVGGVRFKRITFDPAKWDLLPYPGDSVYAAIWAVAHEGDRYNWRLVAKTAAWFLSKLKGDRSTCSQAAAAMGAFIDDWRFDPCTLYAAVARLDQEARKRQGE